MTFLVAAAVLFLALLAGTAIEFPRLCSEGRGGIELSQARLALSPSCRCRGLSSSGLLPWELFLRVWKLYEVRIACCWFRRLLPSARNPA